MLCDPNNYRLLAQINAPDDLRLLTPGQLPDVAAELRQFLINTIAHCGGHFAAGLGTVELTVVLHYLFDTPDDKIIWDVGHQAYPPQGTDRAQGSPAFNPSNRWSPSFSFTQ